MQYLPLVISVIAALFATLQLLLQARMAREMERTKAALTAEQACRGEYLRRYLEAFVQGRERQLDAFRELLQHGQGIRDTLRRAVETPTALDGVASSDELRTAARDILAAYARNQIFFGDDDRKLAHHYKNTCAHGADEMAAMLRTNWPASLDRAIPERICGELALAHERLRDAAMKAVGTYVIQLRSDNDGENGT